MQRNVELIRTVREAVGDGIDLMADAYMGWSLDYAKRMMRLIEPFNLRWLEEAIIPDDVHGYHELRRFGTTPIAAGEHEFTLYGFRQLIEARALDYIQFDTNRVGGITAARKIQALAEAHSIPVVPHAGQMHNYHVVMASLNSPIAEYFPPVDVEVGNELFWYIFKGEPDGEGRLYRPRRRCAGSRPRSRRGSAVALQGDRMTMQNVAVLGSGHHGRRHGAAGWCRAASPSRCGTATRRKAEPLGSAGARIAATPADAARGRRHSGRDAGGRRCVARRLAGPGRCAGRDEARRHRDRGEHADHRLGEGAGGRQRRTASGFSTRR